MTQYDDHLLDLQQKTALKKQLEAKLEDLKNQRVTFDKKAVSLRVEYRQEQEDVEKLEGRSLANYFYNVIGKLDEKQDKERREAYAAKVKLDAAERELAGVDHEMEEIRQQLANLSGCEDAYAAALEEKRSAVKASGAPMGAELLETEERVAALEAQKREISEAISAGRSAMATADSVLTELSDADDWNTWDMFGGGGIITHAMKHSHLDEAQEKVEKLQDKLRHFKTELADISIQADMQVSIDGFLRFADYFFDGLFADWAVGDRINQSQSEVERTRDQIHTVLRKLSDMEAAADRELAALKAKAEDLILNA